MTHLDEFKEFVKAHPLLKDEVLEKRKTWQELYESWVIVPDDSIWDKYKKTDVKPKPIEKQNDDFMKNVLGYLKKVDPDKITKYVGSIQKIIELLGVFGGGAAVSQAAKKKTLDPLFDRKIDEWY